jgi:HK97 family phage major capsid protein
MDELTKREDFGDFLVKQGGEVKAAPDGHVSGYLVTFSDETSPDLSGDFFTKETDFGPHSTTMTLYHHGLDVKVGDRSIGTGSLKVDDVGVWIDAQLEMRDKYEKAIYKLAQKGKLGWSSGTAPHLVKREQKGDAQRILSWPLGLDASLTPAPAEPRNVAISMKSISKSDIESLTEPEGAGDASAQSQIHSAETKVEKMEEKKEEKVETKTAEETVLERFKLVQEEEAKKRAEEKAREDRMMASMKSIVEESMKTAPADKRGGVLGGNLNLKTKLGDDAAKSLNHFLKSGDNGGLRANPEYKTDYYLVEGTQYQGQELVPTEIVARIFAMRDPLSVARAAGANIIQVSSSSVILPKEKVRQGIFVAPGEKTAYDQLEAQIFDKTTVTITKYTRNVPISEELAEDSVADVIPYVVQNSARALAITENAVFITNSTGAWYGSTKGLDFDSATAIGVAEIPELYGKLNPEYRDNVVWICLPATYAYLMSLNTAYAFPFAGNGGWSGALGNVTPGASNGAAGMLLGGRVYCPGSVEAIGATYKSLMVGNFSAGYAICERRSLTVQRDAISNVKEGVINLLFSTRIGGGIVNAEAFQHGLHPTG